MSRRQRGFVSYRTGWFFIALSLVTGAAALLVLINSVGSAINDALFRDPCATPCNVALDLNEGRYYVFELTGGTSNYGPVTTMRTDVPTIVPSDVSVTTGTGEALMVEHPAAAETINRNGEIFSGVASFEAPADGRYQVTVAAPETTAVIVAPEVGRTVLRALPGLALGVLAMLIGLAGFVLLLVTRSRRRKVMREVTSGARFAAVALGDEGV